LNALSLIKKRKSPSFNHVRGSAHELAFHFDLPTSLELDGDFVGSAMSHGIKCLPAALQSWVLEP
jgi:hypothetical protein